MRSLLALLRPSLKTALIVGAAAVLALVAARAPAGRAVVPGTNGLLVIESSRGGAEDLWRVDSSGGSPLKLTETGADYEPAWSPDGTKIAFSSYRSGLGDIYVMNADGSAETNITQTPGADESLPVWSPDGTMIIYRRDNGDNGEIWRMNANGTGQQLLIALPGSNTSPDLSPDGTRLAWANRPEGEDWDIWVANADGSNPVRLTTTPDLDWQPSWSPDSQTLAFTCTSDDREICLIDPDGGTPQPITANDVTDDRPAWSPDGTLIVFSSDRGAERGVYTMTPSGGNVQTVSAQADDSPDWQSVPAVTPTPSPSPSPSPTPSDTPVPTESPPPNPIQGDVDCDGDVDDDDFTFVLQYAAGLNEGTTPGPCLDLGDPESNSGFPWGDVNCDEAVNAVDALYLVAHLAEVPLPPAAENCFSIGNLIT